MLVIDRFKTLWKKPRGYADSAPRYRTPPFICVGSHRTYIAQGLSEMPVGQTRFGRMASQETKKQKRQQDAGVTGCWGQYSPFVILHRE